MHLLRSALGVGLLASLGIVTASSSSVEPTGESSQDLASGSIAPFHSDRCDGELLGTSGSTLGAWIGMGAQGPENPRAATKPVRLFRTSAKR